MLRRLSESPQRSAQSALARYRADAINLRESETGPARRAARRGRAARAGALPRCPPARGLDAYLLPRYAEARGAIQPHRVLGARSVRMRSSAACACTTFAIPPPVRQSWREKVCRSSVGSSA